MEKSLFCGNQYHNGGECLRNSFLSQPSAWYLFPHFLDHLTPRKTYCFFAPGFVTLTFPEDAANISVKVWEFGSRTACCVHKGTVSSWHQQNQNRKVPILEPTLMAVKIVFFSSFYLLKQKSQQCRNLLSMAHSEGRVGGLLWTSSQTELCWDSRRSWFWRPRPQSQMVQPWKSSWPKHFATQPSGNPFCGCCGPSLWSYLHVSNGPLLLTFCTNKSCCLTLDLSPINAVSAQQHPALKERNSQTLPSINIKNMSHGDKATQQLPVAAFPLSPSNRQPEFTHS